MNSKRDRIEPAFSSSSRSRITAFVAGLATLFLLAVSPADGKPVFRVGWSIYVGFSPYYYMLKSGILRKWADKYGIEIGFQRMDYGGSVDAFVARNLDACAMTNMEALDMPSAAGIDTTVLFPGDFSNGNDVLLARQSAAVSQLAGKKLLLVRKTVSEYLLERALMLNGGVAINQIKLVNTSDADIAGAFLSDRSVDAVATWKPMASQIVATQKVHSLFNSSQIPGEIVDLMAIRTDILQRSDGSGEKFARALTGAWYEVMAQMSSPGSDGVLSVMAQASEDSLASFKEQLNTTHMFGSPRDALQFVLAPTFKDKMDLVRQFCFRHKLLGDGATAVDDVAIRFADGSVQGKPDRVRLRFLSTYLQLAAEGKL
jgi:NitT/TauT family transport system substrate-binding protein